MRWLRHGWFLFLLGCDRGGESNDGTSIGNIAFTAGALEVAPCSVVTLEWNVPGADIVNIEADGDTLISSLTPSGTVESDPICATTTFTLSARNASGSRSESLTVTALWEAPSIADFSSDPSTEHVGYLVELSWSVTN